MSNAELWMRGPVFTREMPKDGFVPVQANEFQGYTRDGVRGVKRKVAELAYAEYVRHYGHDQSFDTIHQRGGFGIGELLMLLADALRSPSPGTSEKGTDSE